MQESKIEQTSSSKIKDSEDKITINNSADLYKIPISVLKRTKVYNFQGKYYEKIYNEALDIEKEKAQKKPPKERTIPSYKSLQPEIPKIESSNINETQYENKTNQETKNITNNYNKPVNEKYNYGGYTNFTYNSNHMEGSALSEEQTRLIFETNTIDADDGIPVDDILETVHHFRAIDYVIEHAEEVLTEDFIKELHYILKHDTKAASLSWFAVGEYKRRVNVVGGHETTKPKDVPVKMKELLAEYNRKTNITIEDIITFHSDFEHIHPFQDGNGRVGRLIALKECLHWNIVPFIIEDSKKAFYYRGLSEWDIEKGYLTDTCLDGQDTFHRLLDLFDIEAD